MRISSLLLYGCLLVPLASCASTAPSEELLAPELATTNIKDQTGFLGIDRGSYDENTVLPRGQRGEKLSSLDKLIGEGFDPKDIKSPHYKKAKYKSKVVKEYLLDELMSEAYDAYKEVSGKKWYPKKAIKQKESNDLLLRRDRWLLQQGKNLHDTLFKWAEKAGWHMVWRSDYDYPIRVGSLLKGTFPQVVGKALGELNKNRPPLYATFYKNRVVIFSNKE